MDELHVVLGATGGAGNAVLGELLARGKRIRAITRLAPSRAAPEVEWRSVDALNTADLERACDGASVVYHCVNVPYAEWETKIVPIADSAMNAAAKAGATLVIMDNLYMYGAVTGPILETTPHRPAGPKGRLRDELERRYLAAHHAGTVKLAIGRASDFYGPIGLSSALLLAVDPVLRGKRASWIGDLDAPHTMSYLPDVGWGLVTLGERPAALGDVWHMPAAEPVTGRQFITMVCEAAGKPVRMGVITRPMMMLAGIFDPQVREALEVYYQFAQPFMMDASKFTRAFGSRITPHADAIKATLAARVQRASAAGA
ncbi:MAG TPA: NAD-dependent epimerase/dehydratase family protein [Candidatus Eremiobacteraceae bacterium]|nr:NAD-dependent epimerase/dehydratase family protein [Candidatus Eremiobacteraceae bacterium]